MTKEEVYAIWAPSGSVWSPWVKPVLFSHIDHATTFEPLPEMTVSWGPPSRDFCIVADLPGAEGVRLGLALAKLGYRPVPLYNALPEPVLAAARDQPIDTRAHGAVDVWPIVHALQTGAELLRKVSLPPSAPPAFLLDSNRGGPQKLALRDFDNRSVCFVTDFPSANFLSAQAISNVLLVKQSNGNVAEDLAQVLRKHQEGGMLLSLKASDDESAIAPFRIKRIPLWAALFFRLRSVLGLRRNPAGGFGDWLPDAHSHGSVG